MGMATLFYVCRCAGLSNSCSTAAIAKLSHYLIRSYCIDAIFSVFFDKTRFQKNSDYFFFHPFLLFVSDIAALDERTSEHGVKSGCAF